MPNDLLAELAQLDHIIAVKQANADNLAKVDGLEIYAGNDDLLADVLDLGEPAGSSSRAICSARRCAGWSTSPSSGARSTRASTTSTATSAVAPAGVLDQGRAQPPRHRRRRPTPAVRRARRARDGDGARDARAPRTAADRHDVSGRLRVLPLGGLGEIGKNMTVFEYEDRIVVVDTGLRFPTADMLGIDLVLPDFSYLRERAEDIEAIVITHGHEDHLGRCRGCCESSASDAPIVYGGAPDDGDGALEARRAQPPRRRCSRTSSRARRSTPGRSRSS